MTPVVVRMMVELVDILIYLSEFRLATGYKTHDPVANRYQAMHIVQPASGVTE